jgi:hypothetical protein
VTAPPSSIATQSSAARSARRSFHPAAASAGRPGGRVRHTLLAEHSTPSNIGLLPGLRRVDPRGACSNGRGRISVGRNPRQWRLTWGSGSGQGIAGSRRDGETLELRGNARGGGEMLLRSLLACDRTRRRSGRGLALRSACRRGLRCGRRRVPWPLVGLGLPLGLRVRACCGGSSGRCAAKTSGATMRGRAGAGRVGRSANLMRCDAMR